MKIYSNKIRCKHCGDVIESKHVHDFKYCSCGKCAVDGGHEYLRRIFTGSPEDCYEELSEYESDFDELFEDEEPTEDYEWLYEDMMQEMDDLISRQEAKDVSLKERKHGKWIPVVSDTVHGSCSECGFEAHYYEDDVYGYDYCPNCGARLMIE